jgi:hypothetical protein
MWTSTVILTGMVVVDGTAFRWLVTDGAVRKLTVSHPTLGTRTHQVTASPESQARVLAREMLAAATGVSEAIDDGPMPEDDPEPTTV